MTAAEFQEIVLLVCPHCAKGVAVVQRFDTKEFTHSVQTSQSVSHTICWATGLRNSRFARELKS